MATQYPGDGPSSSNRWFLVGVRYVARFDRTAAQVEQFLRGKGASLTQARHAVGRLVQLRYLNDRAYAERWVEARLARGPMGPARLKAELLGKGIAESLADGAIRKALGDVDEDTLARRALGIRQRRGRQLSPLQASRLLRQWGFEEDTIERMIGDRQETEEL